MSNVQWPRRLNALQNTCKETKTQANQDNIKFEIMCSVQERHCKYTQHDQILNNFVRSRVIIKQLCVFSLSVLKLHVKIMSAQKHFLKIILPYKSLKRAQAGIRLHENSKIMTHSLLVLPAGTLKSVPVPLTNVSHASCERQQVMIGRGPTCSLPCLSARSQQEFVTKLTDTVAISKVKIIMQSYLCIQRQIQTTPLGTLYNVCQSVLCLRGTARTGIRHHVGKK